MAKNGIGWKGSKTITQCKNQNERESNSRFLVKTYRFEKKDRKYYPEIENEQFSGTRLTSPK